MPSVPPNLAISFQDATVLLNGHPILEHLDLDIESGSRIVITGQNGAGKTTLLKTILGLVKPSGGKCVLPARYKARGSIAYLNQESIHVDFPISAGEVAEIGVVSRRISRTDRAAEIASAMAITRCGHLRKRSFSELSGGEKQKVSLARCIAQSGEILLLDEPCASLDPESKAEILSILEEINERLGTTVVMVSHDEETRTRDGWIRRHMEKGRILESLEVDR
jgi:ABC-type Mn2+/Zn2+ transport system ATPase subunit